MLQILAVSVAMILGAVAAPRGGDHDAGRDLDARPGEDDPQASERPVTVVSERAGEPTASGTYYEDAAFVWRGFSHQWQERNHRMNRLGNYIEGQACSSTPCTATLVHGASSGIASDVADYKTYYSRVAANGVGFQAGYSSFTVSGDENGVIRAVKPVQVSVGSNLRDRDRYVVLLNGFNLCANGGAEAKKPVTVFFGIDGEHYDPYTSTVNFLVESWLEVDCDTACPIECRCSHEWASYETRVSYLIIGGDEAVFVTKKDFSREYSWGDDVPSVSNISSSITGTVTSYYPSAVVGFTKILYDVNNTEDDPLRAKDEGHWFKQWITAALPKAYLAASGTMELDVQLHFKAHGGYVFGSYRNSGNAFLQAQAALVQFRDGMVEHYSTTGTLNCDGDCRSSPCSSAAERTRDVSFDY